MDKELVLAYSENNGQREIPEDYEGMAEVIEPGCGDVVRIYLKTRRQIITDCCCTVTDTACPPLKACVTRAVELALGKPVMEAYLISAQELSDFFGALPKESFHCAEMAELALKKAIQDYAKRYNRHSS